MPREWGTRVISRFLIDGVLRLFLATPAPVFHNLSKARALKMAFWHQAVDSVEGCYVEFGVAMGNSLSAARSCERNTHSAALGILRIPRQLHGFDTFEGFSSPSEFDIHPTWSGSRFSFTQGYVQRRFRRAPHVFLHKVDVAQLANSDGSLNEDPTVRLQGARVAIALFDMDLGEPTFRALNYLRPRMQEGTLLIFDEFSAFRSSPSRGERWALQRFLSNNPGLKLHEFITYGDGGRAFQVAQLPE